MATARARRLGAHGGTLRKCVSAGEALPAATRALWREATGIEMIDGIGSTEMLHIFISADEAACPARRHRHGRARLPGLRDRRRRPAAAPRHGRPARGQGPDRLPLPGRRAPGATTCSDGWNITGDAYLVDDDGYFHYQARTDDMIISAGYNIAAPEVEEALLLHPAVAECGVIGVARRGARPDRQGLRRAARRPCARRRRWCARCRTSSRRRRAVQVPARDRVPRQPAAHRDRQAAALQAARAA